MGTMKFPILMAAGLPLVAMAPLMAPLMAAAGVKDGHGEAELLSGSATYQPGKPVTVGIRLKVEEGWHSYWVNPGEGGMALGAKWTLPEGWKAGELQHPVPKRFKTGGLPGFGYEGEAVFLVDLRPPAAATDDAECKVKLSWLTCNDKACVSGNAELALKLPAGDAAAGKDAAVIAMAAKKIPKPVPGLKLDLEESGQTLVLTLNQPPGLDLKDVQAFPATPQVVDAADPLDLQAAKSGWVIKAKKNEYAEGPATLLDIVLAGGKLQQPVLVSWPAKK
jgi:thiol:disulfide interchange protein DsbD